ncbi:STY4528 family pathogenicity island replication protein [Testudinibacter sp. P80/BLE/0925]|uniref:STY4528 family pathogenicity island replication protein n=1 Tax=Testudinibacter sp. TW-1 TaxID=3417757 RepID=UPI003D36E4D7
MNSIDAIVENATGKLKHYRQQKSAVTEAVEGLLYFGNPHDTVPVRLLTDPLLTCRARYAWQVIKHNARAFGGAAFPSYEELQQLLSDRAYTQEKASKKVVSQTLLLLRLTRWLTFCSKARDEQGRILGNIYIIHDEPMSIPDCIHFNENYLNMLEQATHHRDKMIRGVAQHIVKNMQIDDGQSHLVSHIDLMRSRYHYEKNQKLSLQTTQTLNSSSSQKLDNQQQHLLSSTRELGQNQQNSLSSIRELSTISPSSTMELSQKSLSSTRELSDKPLISVLVPSGNSVNQYSTSTYNKKISTVLDSLKFSALEKNTVLKMMRDFNLGETLGQAVLEEAALRIQQGNINKPVGYVCSLIKSAAQGEFKHFLVNKSNEKKLGQPPVTTSNSITSIPMRQRSKGELHKMSQQASSLRQNLKRISPTGNSE